MRLLKLSYIYIDFYQAMIMEHSVHDLGNHRCLTSSTKIFTTRALRTMDYRLRFYCSFISVADQSNFYVEPDPGSHIWE